MLLNSLSVSFVVHVNTIFMKGNIGNCAKEKYIEPFLRLINIHLHGFYVQRIGCIELLKQRHAG